MKKGVILSILIVLLLATTTLAAKEYHMTILAVEESNNTFTGNRADLYLELKEGSGRVFLDTFPLTKFDTQISTRFAKDMACSHFKLDCERYDFIYTIKADSNIIGGPSAGASMAALTTIAVLDLDYNEDVAITGTINSGATIGIVGGVKEKIEAAKKAGIKKVLIPLGARNGPLSQLSNQTNETLDLVEYGKNNVSIDVLEVSDLDEVVYQFTGVKLNGETENITEDQNYKQIMKDLKDVLCQRQEKIEQELQEKGIPLNKTTQESIQNRKESSLNATKDNNYYAAASYCFSANIELKNYFYKQKQLKEKPINTGFAKLQTKVFEQKEKLKDQQINTISDLQTLMIVNERLKDVEKQLDKYYNNETKDLQEQYNVLAYAEERMFSAQSWTKFFAMPGKSFKVDNKLLKETCLKKISEADERVQYAGIFAGNNNVKHIKDRVDQAREALNEKNYPFCLIKAVQAKGDASAILSSMGLDNNTFNGIFQSKLKATEKVIAENSKEGVFPILGYSYYRYAKDLSEAQKYTALVYLEYALEMSNLQIYFPQQKSKTFRVEQVKFDEKWVYAIIALLIGFILGGLVVEKKITPRRLFLRR